MTCRIGSSEMFEFLLQRGDSCDLPYRQLRNAGRPEAAAAVRDLPYRQLRKLS